jgi:hypothetical protein
MKETEQNVTNLISTGLLLGAFHVLTPDHLSALSTLSVGGSWRSFHLGVRWSIGHSIGLLICTFIFIVMGGSLDLHSMSRYTDGFVGIGMVIIGGYGVLAAFRDRDYGKNKKILEGESKLQHMEGQELNIHEGDKKQEEKPMFFLDISQNQSHQRVASLAIGILHGIAGPGGILGVLPAVEMIHWESSACYLGSFILASTLSMGAFAAFYGEMTRRIGGTAVSTEFFLRIFSSGGSALVGFMYLTITLFGGGVSVGSLIEHTATS